LISTFLYWDIGYYKLKEEIWNTPLASSYITCSVISMLSEIKKNYKQILDLFKLFLVKTVDPFRPFYISILYVNNNNIGYWYKYIFIPSITIYNLDIYISYT